MEDIVATTGVCKTWRKALKNSVAIQQALFLSPVDIVDIMSEDDCLSLSLENIPQDHYDSIGEFNIRYIDFWTCCTSVGNDGRMDDRFIPKSQKILLSHPSGIWRDMFVTQPPIKTFALYAGTLKFKSETSVKMGELYDFCDSLLPTHYKNGKVCIQIEPASFISIDQHYLLHGGRWEVRDGRVSRQTQ